MLKLWKIQMRKFVHKFGNANIFRPSVSAQQAIRDAAKKRLLSQIAPGIYIGLPANLALQCLYGFYEKHLNNFVPDIASRSAVEFLVFQYDAASKILHGRGISDSEEMARWLEIENVFRRFVFIPCFCLWHLGKPVTVLLADQRC